jgi:hypothetical protein
MAAIGSKRMFVAGLLVTGISTILFGYAVTKFLNAKVTSLDSSTLFHRVVFSSGPQL